MAQNPVNPTRVAPVLETERLTLRGHTLEDFRDSLAMWSDPQVTRYIGGTPATEEDVWNRLLRYVGHWSLMGFGFWVIREKASGRFVGEVGLADFKRGIQPSIDGVPEAGWALAPWAQGKGYATEAVGAALAWGEPRFGSTRTVCLISPENVASLRVAAKCGFVEWARTTYKGEPTLILERR
ncbi:MAG: GNAT family N-acetyltransferase [Myxococcaceae bacterium]|nr:GNAT family N-acetyltransferase [Myxococcaceae bacterium]MCI0674105.1 GNAT family N-acetyltransferase [Myxococcaceae bacterium]